MRYEKRGRGGWAEEDIAALLTMALTRKPWHLLRHATRLTPHNAMHHHTTTPQFTLGAGLGLRVGVGVKLKLRVSVRIMVRMRVRVRVRVRVRIQRES